MVTRTVILIVLAPETRQHHDGHQDVLFVAWPSPHSVAVRPTADPICAQDVEEDIRRSPSRHGIVCIADTLDADRTPSGFSIRSIVEFHVLQARRSCRRQDMAVSEGADPSCAFAPSANVERTLARDAVPAQESGHFCRRQPVRQPPRPTVRCDTAGISARFNSESAKCDTRNRERDHFRIKLQDHREGSLGTRRGPNRHSTEPIPAPPPELPKSMPDDRTARLRE